MSTPNYNVTLAAHLVYQLLTRLTVLAAAGFMQIAFQTWGWLTPRVSQTPFIIPLALILASAVYSAAFYLRYETPTGESLPTNVVNRAARFPVAGLALDFFNLTLLVYLTGGVESVFLPLYVIALLVGDVSVETHGQRNFIAAWFVATTVIGVLAPTVEPIRCIVFSITPPTEPCASSLWTLPENVHIAAQLLVFIPGALFGSAVLRAHIDRLEATRNTGLAPKTEV